MATWPTLPTLRAYGLEGLRSRIRNHVGWSEDLARRLDSEPDFEIVTQPILSLFSFRYVPAGALADLDEIKSRVLPYCFIGDIAQRAGQDISDVEIRGTLSS